MTPIRVGTGLENRGWAKVHGVRLLLPAPYAVIAQLVEQCIRNAQVAGSNPAGSSTALLLCQKPQQSSRNDTEKRADMMGDVLLAGGGIRQLKSLQMPL